jgi:hypothetical protein
VWPEVVVIEDVLEEFFTEMAGGREVSPFNQTGVERPPEAPGLAVGLRPVRPGVTVFNSIFNSKEQ